METSASVPPSEAAAQEQAAPQVGPNTSGGTVPAAGASGPSDPNAVAPVVPTPLPPIHFTIHFDANMQLVLQPQHFTDFSDVGSQ